MKEVLRFWKLAPCDAEAQVRRLKWAQTLVQDPPHYAQLITAMFGKLPSEPNPTLGPGGEILPEANPWCGAMADLEELEPYDEREVIQRMGRDVRALSLDRELAEVFVSMDVTMLRLRSLAVEVPPWDFREAAGHPLELSEEGVPQRKCCFDEQCEARFKSFKALATRVLRHHRQMEMVSRWVITNQCPVCLAVNGDRKAAHRHLLSSLRLPPEPRANLVLLDLRRDRSRYLGQVHIPLSVRCPVCSAEPGNWLELQQHLAEQLCDVFKNDGFRDAFLGQAQVGGGSAKAGPSSGETGGGRRGQRTRGSATTGGRAGNSVSGQRGRAERDDRHRVQDVLGSMLRQRGPSNVRGSLLYHVSAGPIKSKPEAERADAQEQLGSPVRACVGGVPPQSGSDEGAGARTRSGVEVVLGEQRGEERAGAAGGTYGIVERSRARKSRARKAGRVSCSAWIRSLSPSRERWKQHCSCREE